jgi:hypothetical protein
MDFTQEKIITFFYLLIVFPPPSSSFVFFVSFVVPYQAPGKSPGSALSVARFARMIER